VLNEANGAETFSITDVLKDAITCVSTEQERKGIDSVSVVDYANYIFTTNNINSVKVPKGDSRFLPIQVSDEVRANKEYFNKLYSVLDDDVIMRKFYQELFERDISNFHPSNDRPETELMRDMKEMNADPVEQFIEYWKQQASTVKDLDDDSCYFIKKVMSANELYEAFRMWWKTEGKNDDTRPTRTKFGIRIKQFSNDVMYIRKRAGVEYKLIAI
jgi:predicted transposase YbfD/YdcC